MAATDATTGDRGALAAQYRALTETCGLVDRSERGKLALTGTGAVEFLNGQVTNELLDLNPGEGRYAAFLTHKGKMLGDLRILASVADQPTPRTPVGVEPSEAPARELLLDTERVALQALFDMIRRFKVGYDLELHKRTLESSLLSLVGPDAPTVVSKALGCSASAIPTREHDHVLVDLNRTHVRLIRTDLGIDLLLDALSKNAVTQALLDAGAVPVAEPAAEIVRVESGRPRYGVDLDDTTIPQEAGLNERAVSFTKGCYVGQETVARLYYRGKPNRRLRGLRLSEPVACGAQLLLGERPVGLLSSAVFSPVRGPLGLALVRREAEPGATLTVAARHATAVVVELPFE